VVETAGEEVIEELKERYLVHHVLGEGALGRTYLATDKQGGQVAIKELLPSRMKRWKDFDLFHRECRVLEGLRHSGIPRYIEDFIIESAEQPARLFLVQEFISGRNLQDRLDAGERFKEEQVREIMLQVLEVLDYLHRATPPVIHRDIKPANIMLDDKGRVFLIDFGAVREAVTAEGIGSTIVGTFGYMPPEQYAGNSTAATDLFALGATCVQLLTGRAPGELFDGLHTFRLPAELEVTLGFEQILLKMTEGDHAQRYQSAAAVIVSLKSRFLMISRSTLSNALPIPRDIRPAPRPWPGFHLRDAALGWSHMWVIIIAAVGAFTALLLPIVSLWFGQGPMSILWFFGSISTVVMAVATSRRARAEVDIYRRGRYTLGEVTGRFLSSTNDAGVHLTYRYRVNASFEHGALATNDAAYQRLTVGDPLGVLYLEGEPAKHVLYAVPDEWAQRQALASRAEQKLLVGPKES
jgi:hypothetical protein